MELKDYTIEERAEKYVWKAWTPEYHFIAAESYIVGAKEQKALDDEVIKKLHSIMEHSAAVLGIGTKWFNENARLAAVAELKQEIINYLSEK